MWLYVPNVSTSSPSAPGGAGSTSASDWQCQALARSAWWRGKPSPSRTWSQRCERVSWMKLLSGAMPEPSTAAHGVAALTASLAESRASLTAWPGSASPRRTSATSGAPLDASSSSRGRGSSSSRTSAACSPAAVPSAYGETFADLVTRSRSDYSRRRKSARAMSASASSFSVWPTPASGLPNDGEEPETWFARAEVLKAKGANGNGAGIPLAIAAKAWPTPSATEDRQGFQNRPAGKASEQNQQSLTTIAMLWSTPRASDGEKGGPNQSFRNGTGLPLPSQAHQWMTPRSHEVGQYQNSRGDKTKPFPTLTGAAMTWATPSIADTMGGRMARSGDRSAELLLNGQSAALAESLYSPLAQVTVKTGKPHSKERRSLNPLFVEWLMGWPPGWTLLVSTDFGCSATALSRFKRDMRCALSALALHDAPPAQSDLFG